jgi:uncharacterized Zn finger protein
MSGRGLFHSMAKRPPPEFGIKINKANGAGWGKKWLNAIESLATCEPSRFTRGRVYARELRVYDLMVTRGNVSAKVMGTHRQAYSVTMQLVPMHDAQWRDVITSLTTKAKYSAELLTSSGTNEINEVLSLLEEHLIPKFSSDIVATCSCPDWMDLCKHIAATHYVLADAMDLDPFFLFELRGRTKDELLAALRFHRAAPEIAGTRRQLWMDGEFETVKLESVGEKNWNGLQRDLPKFRFSMENPERHAEPLWDLGPLRCWTDETPIGKAFEAQIGAAADSVRKRVPLGNDE